MRNGRKKARSEYWSVKAIAKRNRLLMDSRLPESKELPPLPRKRGVITRLREGEVAATGWQCAPAAAPAWLTQAMERNDDKAVKRARYERRMKRIVLSAASRAARKLEGA